jgi:hypothetical protein
MTNIVMKKEICTTNYLNPKPIIVLKILVDFEYFLF